MKRFIIGLTMLMLLAGGQICQAQAEEILFTINANDNANQTLKFAGYDFSFQHMDHRTYLYKDKNANSGFQWTTSVISCWMKKANESDAKYDLWLQFFFGGPITLVEPGQVYTKYIDGRNVQMIIEKVSYFTGYRANGVSWAEETLPKYVTVKIVVH